MRSGRRRDEGREREEQSEQLQQREAAAPAGNFEGERGVEVGDEREGEGSMRFHAHADSQGDYFQDRP